jgi:hypothetical protein
MGGEGTRKGGLVSCRRAEAGGAVALVAVWRQPGATFSCRSGSLMPSSRRTPKKGASPEEGVRAGRSAKRGERPQGGPEGGAKRIIQ